MVLILQCGVSTPSVTDMSFTEDEFNGLLCIILFYHCRPTIITSLERYQDSSVMMEGALNTEFQCFERYGIAGRKSTRHSEVSLPDRGRESC